MGSSPTFRTTSRSMSTRPNILLINPCIYDFTAYDFWLRPLGLLYIAGVLKKYARVNLRFIDCLDRHHPLLPKTLKTAPDGRGPLFKQEVEKPEVLGDIPRRYSRYGIPVEVFRAELRKAGRPDLVLLTCTMTYWYPGVRAVVEILQETWGNVPVLLGGVYPTLLPEHALSATGVDAVCRGPGEKKILSLVREFLGDRVCTPVEINTLAEMPFPAFDMMRDTEVLPILTSRG
ncbi:MAG: cobalamin-dependent protein, partial [Candidatus Aminicenantales bacterium]